MMHQLRRITPLSQLHRHLLFKNFIHSSRGSRINFTKHTINFQQKRTFTKKLTKREQSIEELYQKKSPVEHVLSRPDTYVGSLSKNSNTFWILEENEEGYKIIQKEISIIPAFYRIIDELLVNAVDNHRREGKGTNVLKVDIDEEGGWIHVYNNGKSIPLEIHKIEKIYVPELLFGHLLTGLNNSFKK